MSSNKPNSVSGSNRFQGKMRHYHQSNRTEEVSWDEWSGDKVKGPLRRKLEQVLLNFSTLIVGIMLVGGAFFVVYMIMKKILPMVSK